MRAHVEPLQRQHCPVHTGAYARVCGIIRKASGQEDTVESSVVWPEASEIIISNKSEMDFDL
jgi:hypothetical protein